MAYLNRGWFVDGVKKVKLYAGMVALVIAALAIWHFVWRQPANASVGRSLAAITQGAPVRDNVANNQQPGTSGAVSSNTFDNSSEKRWDKGNLYAELATASDLRTFSEQAKRSPEKGGILYASLAMSECRLSRGSGEQAMVNKVHSDISTTAQGGDAKSSRINALNWLKTRCASFSDSELGSAELVSFKTLPAADRDQLWKLRQDVSAIPIGSLDAGQREAQMRRLLQSKEPALLDRVQALAWAQRPGAESGLSAIYVDKVEFGGLNPDHFEFAWNLMACKMAGTCELVDVNVARSCAFNGTCGANVLDGIQKSVGTQYPQVLAVATKLQEALESGNVSRLQPPGK